MQNRLNKHCGGDSISSQNARAGILCYNARVHAHSRRDCSFLTRNQSLVSLYQPHPW